jgi:hypothetical protein
MAKHNETGDLELFQHWLWTFIGHSVGAGLCVKPGDVIEMYRGSRPPSGDFWERPRSAR